MAVARHVYFPGWQFFTQFTGLLVRNCAVCNLHQRGHQTLRQATLKPMQEFHPMAMLHTDLVRPLLEHSNSFSRRAGSFLPMSFIFDHWFGCCGIWGSHQKSGLPYPPDSYLRLSRHQCACAASAREVGTYFLGSSTV